MKCETTRNPIPTTKGNRSFEVVIGVCINMVLAIVYNREAAIVTVAEK